ncbi:MAG: hypothetical protein K0U41_08055 [Gammaproteobacteria bacterium]|nr:hypothetical protein [Gammaproteobacteria bacterium]
MAYGDNWENHIDAVLFGYRTKRQESSKFSPFEVLYGFRARQPIELQLPVPQTERMEVPVETIRMAAQRNLGVAQQKQKDRYDIKHKGCLFKVSEKVWKYNARRDTRMGDKLTPR